MNGQSTNEIIRVKRLPSSFVQMHKGFLEDPNLSYKAKGILAYLLTKPDGWIVRVTDLMKHGKDGREAIYNGLKELQAHGYYQKSQVRDERGRISHWDSIICEVPIWKHSDPQSTPDSPHTGNPYMDRTPINTGVLPDTGFPYVVKPDTVKPDMENPLHSNNKLNNNEGSNNYINTHPQSGRHEMVTPRLPTQILPHTLTQEESLTVKTAQGAEQSSVNHSMTLEGMYEQFWQTYPRKMGKKEGLKAWKKLRPDEALFSAIMTALNAAVQWWKISKTDMRYIPYPAKWLAGEHWQNDLAIEAANRQSTSQGNTRRNAFHNFSQRENSAEYYAEIERIERQHLLSYIDDGQT